MIRHPPPYPLGPSQLEHVTRVQLFYLFFRNLYFIIFINYIHHKYTAAFHKGPSCSKFTRIKPLLTNQNSHVGPTAH